ncbi:hypothetical protein JL720_13111 [Aureococcus anophagefferens]|nr:hypothetical protein JL720_13111 [Aureococcus anophagefferens]
MYSCRSGWEDPAAWRATCARSPTPPRSARGAQRRGARAEMAAQRRAAGAPRRVGAVALAGESAGACIAASVAERVARGPRASAAARRRPRQRRCSSTTRPQPPGQSPSRIVMSFDLLLPINALVAASRRGETTVHMDESMISYYSDAAILGEFPKTLIIAAARTASTTPSTSTRLRRAGNLVVHRKLTPASGHAALRAAPRRRAREARRPLLADGAAGAGTRC